METAPVRAADGGWEDAFTGARLAKQALERPAPAPERAAG